MLMQLLYYCIWWSPFRSANLLNLLTSTQVFSCEFKIFQGTYFVKYLQTTASWRLWCSKATDSSTDGGWMIIWNRSNIRKILHSVGRRIYCVLLLVLVVLLSKHNYVISFWIKSVASVFLTESTWIRWCYYEKPVVWFLVVNQKYSYLSCFLLRTFSRLDQFISLRQKLWFHCAQKNQLK